MAERIETPPTLQGDEKKQLQQVWSYLYQLAESINNNLQGIGSNELTDSERVILKDIIGAGKEQGLSEMETLKSLIIKTADFVQTSLTEYRMNLLGETVASGQFGRYVRHTGLDVAVTPTGITQNYSFEEVVQGLKEYSINAKNYIKTGLLRTVSSIPVYGVAIGKDVVTFSQDGTETYNDGNKVAELTADELSFWQNSEKVASYKGTELVFYTGGTARLKIDSNGVTILNGSTKLAELLNSALTFYHNNVKRMQTDANGVIFYKDTTKLAELLSSALKFYYNGTLRTQMDTDGFKIYDGSTMLAKFTGSRIGFYYNGTETFYIQAGKLYAAGDMEITNGKKMIIASGADLEVKSGGNLNVASGGNIDINGTGNLKLSGSTVEIKSGSTFDVDATNFKISSADKKVQTGDWELNQKGVVNEETNDAIGFGRYGISYGLNKPMMIIAAEPDTGKGYIYFSHYTSNGKPSGRIILSLGNPALSNYSASFRVEKYNGTNMEPSKGCLGMNGAGEWDIYADEVKYNTLTQRSSREIKHDIRDLPEMGERLDRLRTVTFVYDNDENERQRMGMIYEETMDVMPEICTGDESDKAISYVELIPALLKEIQGLRARVKALEEREGGN